MTARSDSLREQPSISPSLTTQIISHNVTRREQLRVLPSVPSNPRPGKNMRETWTESTRTRPRNRGKSRPFHSLFRELFNPLIDIRQTKPATAVINRRRVGPDGQSNKSPSERRRALIERYIARWRTEVGPDFFPALRLIIQTRTVIEAYMA